MSEIPVSAEILGAMITPAVLISRQNDSLLYATHINK
jgi:hypothetical protein